MAPGLNWVSPPAGGPACSREKQGAALSKLPFNSGAQLAALDTLPPAAAPRNLTHACISGSLSLVVSPNSPSWQ